MASDAAKLVVAIEANTKQFENALKRMEKSTNAAFKGGHSNVVRLNTGMNQAAASAARLNSALASTNATATQFGRGLLPSLSGITAALSVGSVVRYADAWTVAGNKIAAASEISGKQARSLQRLNELATETRTGLTETVDLYSKLLRATADVAKSEEDVARATEIVNKAFKAGGAATSEQIAGILQLAQGLSSGILQGDELRSIRENAPLIAQAIADEFKTTIGGLKELGATGELTAARIFRGILAAEEDVQRAFVRTQSTVGDSITNLSNAFTQLVGNIDKTIGITSDLTKTLNFLSAVMDRISESKGDIGSVIDERAAERLEGLIWDLDLGVQRMKDFDEAAAKAALSTKDLATQIDAALEKIFNGPDAVLATDAEMDQLQQLRDLLAIGTPRGVEAAMVAMERLAKSSPQFQPLVDILKEARDAALGIGKAIEAIPDQNFSDKARKFGGFMSGLETEAAKNEFQQKLDRETDKVLEAAEKLGITLSRADAELKAVRLIGLQEGVDHVATAINDTAELIKHFEGFISDAKLDPSTSGRLPAKFRVGFGSDELTSPTGQVTNVTSGSTTTLAAAERDLARRIQEFQSVIVSQIGAAFGQFTAPVQAALTSIAYNYGRLPPSVAAAARTGDTEAVARAVENLSANPDRRKEEAALIRTGEFGLTEQNEQLRAQAEARAAIIAGIEREIEALGLEAKAFGQTTFEAEKAKVAFDLLNQAKDADLEITPELEAEINRLATAYATLTVSNDAATAAQDRFKEGQQAAIDRMDAFGGAAKDVLGGFISDLRAGKSGAEALANALDKIIDKLIDMALNALFQGGKFGGGILGHIFGGLGGGGGGLGAGIGGLAPAIAPASIHVPRIAAGGAMGARGAPAAVYIVADEGNTFVPRVASISGAVHVRQIKTMEAHLPGSLANRQARGL